MKTKFRNISKRALAFVISLVMILGLFPPIEIDLGGFKFNFGGLFDMSVPVFAAASGTHTPVEGITVGVSGASDNSMSNGAVTVTAKGSGGIFGMGASAKTATITITNNTGSKGNLSFNWTATSVNQLTIDGTIYSGSSGSFNKTMDSGASFKVTITTAKNSTVNKLVMSNFAFTEAKEAKITFIYTQEHGSVSVDGTEAKNGDVVTIGSDGATLKATELNGYKFFGWKKSDGSYEYDNPWNFTASGDETIIAEFISSSAALFGVGSVQYYDLNEAASAANTGSDKTIKLLNSGTLPADSYTIPSGVTLLIPRNESYKLYGAEPEFLSQVSKAADVPNPFAWRTLTLANGAKINVEGTIEVAGKFKTMQGGFPKSGMICDAYGAIYMSQGSNITLSKAGATLYAWGYIYGNGSVVATNGTKVYEIIQVPDYLGGTNLSGFVGDNAKKSFPFSQYYIQNIEVPLTINYGATEFVYTAMTVDAKVKVVDIGTPIEFIGANGMFVPEPNSNITKTYDPTTDRLIFDINGDAQLKNLVLDMSDHEYAWALKLIIKSTVIDSADYILSLNGNITVNVNSGTMTIGQNVTLLPGVKIYVEQGATVDLSSDPNAGRLNASGTGGYNLYVFNKAQWGAYIFQNQPLLAAQYSPSSGRKVRTVADLTDVEIDINGTIICNGFVYTTTDGVTNTSAVISSKGTGTIIFQKGAGDATTFYHLNGANTELSTTKVVSAVLKNAKGTYVETSGATPGTTYQYCTTHGIWYTGSCGCCTDGCTWKAATCTAPKTCSVCGATEGAALGHTPGAAATCTTAQTCTVCSATIKAALGHKAGAAATCTTAQTCTVCGATIKAALGHTWSNATCTAPKTCSVCGATEGAALGHKWTDADCDTPKTCSVCKVTEGEALGHTAGADATCTTAQTCTVCGAELTAALGHTFGETVAANSATCLAAGNAAYKQCTVCTLYFAGSAAANATDGKADTTSFVIPQLDHSYTGAIQSNGNGKDATHSFKCVNGCNEYGNATAHTWNSGAVTTAPGCESEGVKTYTCTVDGCGATYTEAVSATGHSWSVGYKWDKVEEGVWTCTATRTCANSKDCTLTETVTASGSVTTKPTCTDKGWTTYTADFTAEWATDGQTKGEQDIPATGHTAGADATCTTPQVCIKCGATLNGSLGHKWGDTQYAWDTGSEGLICIATRVCEIDGSHVETKNAIVTSSVTTPATCTATGWTTYTATFDQEEGWNLDTRTLERNDVPADPNNHDLKTIEAKAPTCTEIGWDEYVTCQRDGCEYTTYEEIPATGHAYSEDWKTSETNHWHECACGAKSEEANHADETIKDHKCDTCGYVVSTCSDSDDADHKCDHCGTDNITEHSFGTEWKKDETNHWHECACGAKSEEANHSDETTKDHKCDTCEYVMSECADSNDANHKCDHCGKDGITDHDYGTAWKTDATNHWHECACGEKSDVTAHSDVTTKDHKCDTCEYVMSECADSDDADHKCDHCGKDGITDHVYGTEWESDETNHWHECNCGAKSEEANHGDVDTDNNHNCDVCGKENVTEHDYSENWTIGETTHWRECNCGAKSEEANHGDVDTDNNHNCDVCGKENVTEHDYSEDWTIGETTHWHECACGAKSDEAEHIYNNQVVTPPTATEDVKITYTCECGSSYTEIVKPRDFIVTAGNRSQVGYTEAEGKNLVIPAVFQDNYGIWYRVTWIGSEAFSCDNLVSVTIPDSVTKICSYAFRNCTSLESVTIGNGVTIIDDYAFDNCQNLISITIPDSVTSIGYATFSDCASLESVTIGNGVTSIGQAAFARCTSLESVTIGNSVTSIGAEAFLKCSSLKSITIPDSVTSIDFSTFAYCTSLTSITIPDSVTSIGTYAFRECSNLMSITIPDAVTNLGQATFYNCIKLTTVNFGENSKLMSLDVNVFYGCTSLENITIPDSVTSIGDSAFIYCKSLKSINIPNSVTSIGDSAFHQCMNLETVTMGNGVTSIGSMAFYVCTNLKRITITNSVQNIGNYAFASCTSLESVTMGNGVTSLGYEVFYNCSSLESITIPDSVTSIGSRAFAYCTNLTSIKIPNNVTSIGSEAFYKCTNLKSVTIGHGVTSIGQSAFDSCSSLKDVYYIGNNEEWPLVTIGESNDSLLNATLHYICYNGNHTEVVDAAVAPTCTETGLTEGSHCSSCEKSIVAQETVDALGHTAGAEATCTTAQLCTVCSATIKEALGHAWGDTEYDWEEGQSGLICTAKRTCTKDGSHTESKAATVTSSVKTPATCTEPGSTTYTATFDAAEGWTLETRTLDKYNNISPTNHANKVHHEEIDATCVKEGTIEYWSCPDCGKNFSDEVCTTEATDLTIAIDSNNHVNKTEHVQQAATCLDKGYTAGTYCEDCDKWISGHEEIPASGHAYDDNFDASCNYCSHIRTDAKTLIAIANGVKYDSIESALNAVLQSGGEIVLYQDITLNNAITISGKSITISGNATIETTATDLFTVTNGGTLTLGEGLTVNSNTSILWANGGTINVNGATLNSKDSPYALAFAENGGTININSGTLTTNSSSAVAVRNNATVNIIGGLVETTSERGYCAAFAGSGAKLNITGGTVKAATGYGAIAVNGGTVNVSGGTVNGVLAHESSTAKAEISGGDITGNVYAKDGASLTVKGGSFVNDVTEYCVDGYHTEPENGKYVYKACVGGSPVKEHNTGATVGEENYYNTVIYCKYCKQKLSSTKTTIQLIETTFGNDNEVPKSIQNNTTVQNATGTSIVEKLHNVMSQAVKDKIISDNIENEALAEKLTDAEITSSNLIDVILQYEDENGEMQKADENHFPENGELEIILPVPENTSHATHTYFIAHMFTVDVVVNGEIVYRAGDIEYPEVTEIKIAGAEYIRFVVHGLSPITEYSVETDPCAKGHVDSDFDHQCDRKYCDQRMGDHYDENSDHICEYGCSVKIGDHADYTYDHNCDICGEQVTYCKDNFVTYDANDPTCTSHGNSKYYECRVCNKFYSDANAENEIEMNSWVINSPGHTEATRQENVFDSTCQAEGCYDLVTYCSVCGNVLGTASGQTIPLKSCKDADKNHKCDYGCDKPYGEHVDADKDHACDYGCSVKDFGACEDKDLDHACDYGCDKPYGEHVDADNDHGCDYGCSVAIGEHKDTDNDHMCNYCGGQVSDHDYGDGDITTEPSCTTTGVRTYTCSICKDSYTDTIAAKGHDYDENGQCTVNGCGSLHGDINGDGTLTAVDVVFLKAYLLGKLTISDSAKLASDIDGNGTIEEADIGALQNKVLSTKFITSNTKSTQ